MAQVIIRQKLQELFAEYEAKSYSELIEMASVQLEPLFINGMSYDVVVSTEPYFMHLILMVQLERRRFFGLFKQTWNMTALIQENGRVQYLDYAF